MKLKNLVGYQLMSINDDAIIVKNRETGHIHVLGIEDWYGDCCGFNEIETKLLVSEDELTRNPIITNVVTESKSGGCSERAKITFFGEVKALAELNSRSSSGSGWQYGACVTVVCKSLNMDEVITSW